MVRGMLLAFICALGVMVFHILIAQVRKPKKMFNLVFGLFLCSLAVYALLYAKAPDSLYVLPRSVHADKTLVGFWNGLFLSLLFFLNYMQCLYYVTRPVTLRILMEFLESLDGKLTLGALEHKYGLNLMIESRLELITLYGYSQKHGLHYSLTSKGKKFARLLSFLRGFFGVPYYLQPQKSTRGS